jgi:hypothetical protein
MLLLSCSRIFAQQQFAVQIVSHSRSIIYFASSKFALIPSTNRTQMIPSSPFVSRAAWPNGKALLSGGKDCGFESHRRRFCFCLSRGSGYARIDFCVVCGCGERWGRREVKGGGNGAMFDDCERSLGLLFTGYVLGLLTISLNVIRLFSC